jgi:hypothetical protein
MGIPIRYGVLIGKDTTIGDGLKILIPKFQHQISVEINRQFQ